MLAPWLGTAVVETPRIDRLVVKWETVDDHIVDFRNSEDLQEWRRLVSPYFDGAPMVTHSDRDDPIRGEYAHDREAEISQALVDALKVELLRDQRET